MKEAESNLTIIRNSGGRVYLPANIVSDSSYPFPREEKIPVKVAIRGRKIVVSPVDG